MKWEVAAIILAVIDQVWKWMALRNPEAIHKNFGIIFDIPVSSLVMIPLILAVIVIAGRAYVFHRADQYVAVPLAMIIMGGFSNLFDRLAHGFIVDYLIVYRSAFNLADLMILGGIVALVLFHPRHSSTAAS